MWPSTGMRDVAECSVVDVWRTPFAEARRDAESVGERREKRA